MLLYLLAVTSPVLLVGLLATPTDHGFAYQVGTYLGLTAFAMLAMQFVLSARLRCLERPFGLDALFLFHRAMGTVAGLLLLAHPVLLGFGHDGWATVISLDSPWYIWLGRAALLLLVLHIVAAIFRSALRIEYQLWRRLHDWFAVAILGLVFVHSLFAGADMEMAALRGLWWALLAAAALSWIWHRWVRPLRLRRSGRHTVAEVRPETDGVWTIAFESAGGDSAADHLPGQFHFITLLRGRGLPEEEHHFTISSSPAESGRLASTIKASGDFTATIGETRVGDEAILQGPFGRFSYTLHAEARDLLMIAGGIGITPLMSMLRHLRDTGDRRRVLLLYANTDEKAIVFREELDRIAADVEAGPELEIVHVLSKPTGGWQGETGHIDRDTIAKYAGDDLAGREIYLCGPDPMRAGVLPALRELGAARRRVHYERFKL